MSPKTHPMLINGSLARASKFTEVINPVTEEVVGQVGEAEADSIKAALRAAERGFAIWSRTSAQDRRAAILRYAGLLEESRDRIIALLRAETGKLQDNAEYDFGMLVTCLRFFVEECERLDQPVLHDPSGRFLHYVQRQPRGVVVGLLAWNFPLLNLGYKLGPALAAGCSLIIKPSTHTPLASLESVLLARQAGIPDGVINMITSSDHELTKRLLQSEIPAVVTMIGSTRGGLEVLQAAGTSVKHFSVELGGNAPVLVYADADIPAAAHQVVDLKFANCGQVCVSPNRCFVHESVYEEFVEHARTRAVAVEMGPMITDDARREVLGLVESAVADGARIVCGGKARAGQGYFMEPTILDQVVASMKIARDEIFGPVLPIIKFTDVDDEIALANDTAYGLAAYVFTTNLARGLRAARDIDAGSVCINEPHYSIQLPHGGLKQSGTGKDCSRYSLQEYLTTKRVSVLIE